MVCCDSPVDGALMMRDLACVWIDKKIVAKHLAALK